VTTLLGILAVLAALILIIVITPVRLTLAASGGPLPDRVELALWGVRVYRWRPGEGKAEAQKPSTPKPKAKRESGAASQLSWDRLSPVLKILRGPAGRRLAGRMVRTIQIRQGWMHVRFGFDDPAQTGLIAGAAYALNPQLARINLTLEPDFTEAVFGLNGVIALETSLARLYGPPLRFLFEPGAARALWSLAFGPAQPKPEAQTQTPH
jgi:hypothetical protein